jgi:hypothetical protein
VLVGPRSGFSGREQSPSGASSYPRPWATPRGEGKQHGLYVVDVGDGASGRPFFLTTTVRPATALGGEEGLTGLPLRSRAQHLVALSGVGLHWRKRFTAEHGDTMDSPQMETEKVK